MKDVFGFDSRSIPSDYLRILVQWLIQKNHKETALLEGSGLEPNTFFHNSTLISCRQYNRILENALFIANTNHLGLTIGKSLDMNSHGLLGYAIITSSTLKEALHTFVQYSSLYSKAVNVTAENNENYTNIRFECTLNTAYKQLYTYELLLSSFYNILCAIHDEITNDISFELSIPRPSDWNDVITHIDFDVRFDCPYNAIVIPNRTLSATTKHGNRETFLDVQKILDESLNNDNKICLISKLRNLIAEHPYHKPSFDNIADAFSVSPRTLRRELLKFDTSYREVLDNTRKNIIIDYLVNRQLDIKKTSQVMGFKNSSQLKSKFEQWTEKPIEEYIACNCKN